MKIPNAMKLSPLISFSWALLSTCPLAATPIKLTTVPLLVPELHDSKGNVVALSPRHQKLIELISAESGLQFDIKPYPWRRAQRLAQLGNGLLWGVIKTEERKQYLSFTNPIAPLRYWLVVQAGKKFPYHNIHSLRGKRIVIANGDQYGDEFNAHRDKLFTVEEETLSREARLAMLVKNRADVALMSCFLSDAKQFEARLNRGYGDIGHWSVLSKPMLVTPIHIAAARDHPLNLYLPTLNRAIERLQKRGAIHAAMNLPDKKPDAVPLPSEPLVYNKRREKRCPIPSLLQNQ
ncbi:substrate-binding periplasmic protein [Chitinimonas sp. PSY-7]|uniref:substrate-binding periplasmic protein n=1 Tax=Chitinimonas sp. PSY-7 TaxID=3459088 RepID=UPI0040401DE1